VNPDFLPEEDAEQKKMNEEITLLQAVEIYDQLFNTEKLIDKIIDEYEK
jgi:hypothetical protein